MGLELTLSTGRLEREEALAEGTAAALEEAALEEAALEEALLLPALLLPALLLPLPLPALCCLRTAWPLKTTWMWRAASSLMSCLRRLYSS